MPTPKTFVDLVAAMRDLQKAYYQTPRHEGAYKKELLKKAKAAEKAVDAALVEIRMLQKLSDPGGKE